MSSSRPTVHVPIVRLIRVVVSRAIGTLVRLACRAIVQRVGLIGHSEDRISNMVVTLDNTRVRFCMDEQPAQEAGYQLEQACFILV